MPESTPVKAYAVLNSREKLQPWEYEPDALKPNEIDIKVTHNALFHTNLHMRDNDWGVSQFSLVAGHEVVGEVIQMGEGVTSLKIGHRIGFGWIRNSCGRCDYCLQGEENICRNGFLGHHGGFANRMRCP